MSDGSDMSDVSSRGLVSEALSGYNALTYYARGLPDWPPCAWTKTRRRICHRQQMATQ